MNYTVRPAKGADIDVLVGFTVAEAREAEGEELDAEEARRGVAVAFEAPQRARYWVAESSGGRVVASTSIVEEWSNFHGGWYWWVQSLFIAPEHRGGGLVDVMLNHLAAEASAAGALDLRLYVHEANDRALRAYERCGFKPSPYRIMSRPVK